MGVAEDLEADEAEVGADDAEDAGEEAPHVRLAAAPQPAPSGLPPEDMKRLRATLDGLIACRELLDSALGDPM